MSVFAVRTSENPEYRELDLDSYDVFLYAPEGTDMETILKFNETNTSMSEWWQTIPCGFYNEANDQHKGIADITLWWGASLLLSKKAYNFLKDSIEPFGEFLPLTVSYEPYYIFNCLSYGIDNLEACESEHRQGERLWVTKLDTRPKDKGQLLFKSEYERGNTLLCNERFADIVNQLGLTGLSFDSELIRNIEI